MSSPNSSRDALPSASTEVELCDALVAVAENSLFALAEPMEDWSVECARSGPPAAGWYLSTVGFRGGFIGAIELAVDADLLRQLCMAFAGLPPDGPLAEEHVLDFGGELANMVCGTWLTRRCPSGRFDLDAPRVLQTPRLPAPPFAGASQAELWVSLNDVPTRVRLLLSPDGQA